MANASHLEKPNCGISVRTEMSHSRLLQSQASRVHHFLSRNGGGLRLTLANLVLRALTLISRFVLISYLTKFVGLSAVGEYGLIVGIVTVVPSVIGLGFNAYLCREIVDKPKAVGARMIRDRLTLTSITFLATTALCLVATYLCPALKISYAFATITIAYLEAVAADSYNSLVYVKKQVLANFFAFLRSAAWIYPAVIFGLGTPSSRTLSNVLAFWVAGLSVSILILGYVAHRSSSLTSAFQSINSSWIIAGIRRSAMFYVADVSFVGSLFVDRYIIDHYMGLSSVGVYTFFWSISNAVHTLVVTGVSQNYMPRLVSAYLHRNRGLFDLEFRSCILQTAIAGGTLGVAATLAIPVVARLFGRAEITSSINVFVVIMCGTWLRIIADALNYGVFAQEIDRSYVGVNLLGLVLSASSSAVLIPTFGLSGAGAALILTSATLVSMRTLILFHAASTSQRRAEW